MEKFTSFYKKHKNRLFSYLLKITGDYYLAADIMQESFTRCLERYGNESSAALLYTIVTTAMGLVISAFMKSQIAAIFATALLTMIPATQYSGLVDPVSSLQGAGAVIGRIYPTAHFVTITRGTFSKGLDFGDLSGPFIALLITIPVLLGLGVALLKKQAN